MAASGNPNQAMPFDVQKLFKPTGTPNPSLPVTNPHPPPDPFFSTSSSSFRPSYLRFFHPLYQQFYMAPSTTPTAPHNFHVSSQVAKSVSYPSSLLNPFNAGNQILALINSPPQNLEFPHRPHLQLPPPEFMYHGGANVGSLRVPSGKLPRGRRLAGSHVTYVMSFTNILGKPEIARGGAVADREHTGVFIAISSHSQSFRSGNGRIQREKRKPEEETMLAMLGTGDAGGDGDWKRS
ncbi:hypothetical protein SLA2020_149900 [Shorea laevis]